MTEMKPQRVRLSRAKGWRKPANTVVVARPSRWGNPFKIGRVFDTFHPYSDSELRVECAEQAVELYRRHIEPDGMYPIPAWLIRERLAGKNLACWCPLDQPCHADVLLEIANGADR